MYPIQLSTKKQTSCLIAGLTVPPAAPCWIGLSLPVEYKRKARLKNGRVQRNIFAKWLKFCLKIGMIRKLRREQSWR
jgi:hypothetical protein